MDDRGSAQLLDPIDAPQTETGGAGKPPATGVKTAAAGASGPRRALLVGVIVVVLLALAAGAWALLRHEAPADTAAAEIAVPDLRGMTLDRAGEEVLAAGLAPGTINYAVVEESVATSGTVLSQDPLPGALVEPGSPMNVVIAQGPVAATVAAAVTGEEPAVTPQTGGASAGDAGAGSGDVPPPPGQNAPLPDMPAVDPGAFALVEPRVANPGIFDLVQPEYRTVVEHEGFGAEAWQSAALTFGDKPKRVLLVADGPQYVPIAVWAWGPNDTDWKLKTIWASFNGAFYSDEEDNGGGTLIEPFNVGAGTHTILVRLNPDVKWWKVVIQEQK